MFQGNEKLRKAGEKIEYTPEMVREYIRCKEDIIYFCKNYVHVISLDDGDVLFEPFNYQKKILKCLIEEREEQPYTIAMLPRQMGKCLNKDVKIKIRNKKTGKIEEISIGDFYTRVKQHNDKSINQIP